MLTNAAGSTLRVNVEHGRVFLIDADKNDVSPRVKGSLRNINRGNKQIAHGINRALRPIDL